MQADNINVFGLETMVCIVCFAKFFFFSWFYGREMQWVSEKTETMIF